MYGLLHPVVREGVRDDGSSPRAGVYKIHGPLKHIGLIKEPRSVSSFYSCRTAKVEPRADGRTPNSRTVTPLLPRPPPAWAGPGRAGAFDDDVGASVPEKIRLPGGRSSAAGPPLIGTRDRRCGGAAPPAR